MTLLFMPHLQDARYGWNDKRSILAPPEHPYFSLEAYSTHTHMVGRCCCSVLSMSVSAQARSACACLLVYRSHANC